MKTWLVLIVGGGEQAIPADKCIVDHDNYLCLYVGDELLAMFAPGQFVGFINSDLCKEALAKVNKTSE